LALLPLQEMGFRKALPLARQAYMPFCIAQKCQNASPVKRHRGKLRFIRIWIGQH